jgi:hypothetical protein
MLKSRARPRAEASTGRATITWTSGAACHTCTTCSGYRGTNAAVYPTLQGRRPSGLGEKHTERRAATNPAKSPPHLPPGHRTRQRPGNFVNTIAHRAPISRRATFSSIGCMILKCYHTPPPHPTAEPRLNLSATHLPDSSTSLVYALGRSRISSSTARQLLALASARVRGFSKDEIRLRARGSRREGRSGTRVLTQLKATSRPVSAPA